MVYYDVHLVYGLGADVTVSAKSKDEAIKKAKEFVQDDMESNICGAEYALDFEQCDYCKRQED